MNNIKRYSYIQYVGAAALLLSTSVAQADISGKVFHDTNTNGTVDTDEQGISGVTVKAFNASGTQTASATSSNDGTYTLTLPAGDFRLEFSWAQTWLKPGAAGGTSVQFVADGVTTANLALHNPAQTAPAGSTPSVATSVHSGSVHYGDEFVLNGNCPFFRPMVGLAGLSGFKACHRYNDNKG